MKPNFALSLSFDGIRLLHRTAGGWRLVGEVALEAEDMAAELAMLRKTATSLEPGGVRSKILIPNGQIKYLTIQTPGAEQPKRRAAATEALAGATPYAVSELVFDISTEGPRTHIAAVARETLEEAEAFAVEHRFHPVSFAAMPEDETFVGEPFFGLTETSGTLLESGEKVEPDSVAVVVVGDSKTADHDTAPARQESADKASGTVVAVAMAAPDEPPASAPIEIPEPANAPIPADPTPDSVPDEAPQPTDPTPPAAPEKSPEVPADPTPAPTPQEAPQPAEPDPVAPPAEVPPPVAPQPKSPPLESPTPPAPETRAAAASQPVGVALRNGPQLPPTHPAAKPPAPQSPPIKPSLGAANRAGNASKPSAPAVAASKPATANVDPLAISTGFISRRGAENAPALGAAKPVVPDAVRPVPAVALSASKAQSSNTPPTASTESPAPATKAGFLSRRKPKAADTHPRKAEQSAPTGRAAARASEAERMTVFGARRSAGIGGKPRFLGLMLTLALLVFLAGVAAWASVFLDDGRGISRLFGDRAPKTVTAPTPEDAEISPQAALVPQPAPENPVTTVETASLEPGLSDEDGAILDALSEPVLPEPDTPPTEAEIDAKYAATGIWMYAPNVPPEPAGLIDIEDLYLTSIDPVSTSTDAVALPAAESFASDLLLASLSSPAAAGTNFALGPDGLVIPTAQGAISPDGVTVYLGRPGKVAPATMARFQAVPQETAVAAEQSALAAFRPKTRPEDLEETTERAQLDGLTRSELADFRPALRAKSLQEAAQEALNAEKVEQAAVVSAQDTRAAVAAALLSPPVVPEPEVVPTVGADATKFAVASSVRPDTRPRNFGRLVKRAEKLAPREETIVASAAAVAPRVVQPSIPSKTSVAKQATTSNAINLRKINLIGVYGKPSERRALVRLGNGRYQKLVVGDKIDGGRVSAIGDSELRYSKGGRNVVLKMPNT